MPTTMTLISSVILNTNSGTDVTFSSIPSTYTDLKILGSARVSYAGIQVNTAIDFNNTYDFSYNTFAGNGSNVAADNNDANISPNFNSATSTANTFNNFEIYIPNYTSSSYKSFLIDSVVENNGTSAYLELTSMQWNNTSPITSITFYIFSNTWIAGSSFYLYGVKKS